VKLISPYLPIPYGTHHTKMMILFYTDGSMHVVVHTANLRASDWGLKSQGVWVSPLFYRKNLSMSSSEVKPAQFEVDLCYYLSWYKFGSATKLIERLHQYDFNRCVAILIFSIPGQFSDGMEKAFSHLKVKESLSQLVVDPKCSSDDILIGQFSSMGSLGKDETSWLTSEWFNAMSSAPKPDAVLSNPREQLKLIFPTVDDVRNSLEGYSAGDSIPYDTKNSDKQQYLLKYMHSWSAERTRRTRAMPHVKSYARMSAQGDLRWFLLTSANMSKAAWGSVDKKDTLMIRSYEMGVLLFDRVKVEDTQFHLRITPSLPGVCVDDETKEMVDVPIPVPYDVPLKPYKAGDRIWTWNTPFMTPDTYGRVRNF
jgi:tyrosyl-DNA phosphodiesterase-1